MRSFCESRVAPQDVHHRLERHLLVDGFRLVVDLAASHGSWLVDARDGQEYLDLYTFFASAPLGANPPGLADDPAFMRVLADGAQTDIERLLGTALLVGAAAMVLRYALDLRAGNKREGVVQNIHIHTSRTIAIGMVGGLVVGMTSVGSGSLMIVLMLFLYPMLGANQLVGTDLAQALPLTASAALGALTFGDVSFGVTTSLIIGSIPAVLVGSVLSSRAPDRVIRPVITFVIFASGLKYIGVGNKTLGWSLVGVLFAGFVTWLLVSRPWASSDQPSDAAAADT